MTHSDDTTRGPRAIETQYKGYRFRSRLEARWAVFFDVLGVRWEYEKEGYELGAVGRYLPDFWLTDLKMWAEVKANVFTDDETAKAQALANQTQFEVMKLIGPPTYVVYWAIQPKRANWKCGPLCEIDVPEDQRHFRPECYGCYGQMDYILDDQYCHDEHRWFCSPGLADGEDASKSCWASPRTRAAYAAARAARFEFGEHG